MRYGYRVDMPGMTQDQYDGLHAQIGAMLGGIPGLLVHIAGPTESGWYVAEVWASKADFDDVMAKIGPMLSSPDAPPMTIQEFTVYNCETSAQLAA